MQSELDRLSDLQTSIVAATSRFARGLLQFGIIPNDKQVDLQNHLREGIRQIKAEHQGDPQKLNDLASFHRILILALEPRSASYSTEEVLGGSMDEPT